MIRVVDDFYIEVETSPRINYVVRRGEGIRDEKNRNKDKIIGYGKDMANALEMIRAQIIAKRLERDLPTVSEALRAIREENRRFNNLLAEFTA